LKQIAPDHAEAIILYFFSNLTSAEVSQVLKKSPAAIEMHIGRGIQDLRTRTSLTADGEKGQKAIDPDSEEDALLEKLADTASRIIPDPLFISELEQALIANHQPKIKRTLPVHLQQLGSVVGWIMLIAIGAFLLNWRVAANPAIKRATATLRTPLVTEAASSTPIPRTVRVTPTRIPTQEYTVQSGDTCTYIAERFSVTIDELITLNDLNSACDIYIDQILVIPITTSTP
jgi:LysM repeat protein